MQTDVLTSLKRLVGSTFGVAPESLSGNTCADDIDGWDSLAHSALLIRIRKTFNVDIDEAAANVAGSLAELAGVIARAQSR